MQEKLFEEETVAAPPPRQPLGSRAGTKIDHKWAHDVMVGRKQHGLYDESQRVYQTGGELKKFIYWRDHLVTFAADAWRQFIDKVDWLEVIDHERNEVWRISAQRARNNARRYDAGIGERIGVPMDLWTVYDSQGVPK